MAIENEQAFATSFALGHEVSLAVVAKDLSRIVVAFGDKITVVDVASKKMQSTIGVQGNVNDLAMADGSILAVTNRDTLVVQSLTGTKEIKLADEGTAVIAAHGFAYVGTKRGSLVKVDLASGKIVATTQISSSKVTRLAVGHQGKLVAVGSSNGLLSVYSLADDKVVSEDLKYHNMPITAIAFDSNDTRCLTAAHERDVHSWDLIKMKHLDVFESRSR